MRFVLTLHSHLPWVLHHGRWPHGSDWICEAALDTYLPLVAALGPCNRPEHFDGLFESGVRAVIGAIRALAVTSEAGSR